MTNRAAAARFARALFDVSRASDPERTGRELNGFVDLVGNHPELLRTLTSPALPPSVKQNIVAELLKLQPLAGPLGRILMLLAERDQLALVPLIAEAYQQRLLDFQQVVRARGDDRGGAAARSRRRRSNRVSRRPPASASSSPRRSIRRSSAASSRRSAAASTTAAWRIT